MPAACVSPIKGITILPSRRICWVESRFELPGKVIFNSSPSRRMIISEWAFSAGRDWEESLLAQPVNPASIAVSRLDKITARQENRPLLRMKDLLFIGFD